MISIEQARNALSYLDAAAQNMQYEDETHKAYNVNMRKGAVATLKQFIAENTTPQDIQIVYEFKLRDKSTGLYMDRSNWTKKGKTYSKRNNLAVALGTYIGEQIDKDSSRPRFDYYRKCLSAEEYSEKHEAYRQAYNAWYERKVNDKEWRASFLPDDWIVVCIPVNTTAQIIEMSAKDFYKGKAIET
jgi:hypothetical protein